MDNEDIKAIETKYLSATDTRGARIKATAGKLTATVPYNYSLSELAVAFEAVEGLVRSRGFLQHKFSNETYYEGGDDYWKSYEYDSKGNEIHYEASDD